MTSDTLPGATRVGRVTLRVGDLDRVADFYESVVGLERLGGDATDRDANTARLGTGDDELLRLVEDPDAPDRGRDEAGLFHVAVRVPTREALADALERGVDAGTLTGTSDHLVSEALYHRDPEGNGVEVYWDRPRSEWPTEEGRIRMDTVPLDTDALGDLATGAATAPAGTDVGHVHLEVTSLPAARSFYVDTLGMNVRQEWGPSALFVAAGDYHHHVGLNTWNDRTAPARSDGRGLDWFELVIPDETALEACRQRVESAGLDVEPVDDGGFAVRDPDGIPVRIRTE